MSRITFILWPDKILLERNLFPRDEAFNLPLVNEGVQIDGKKYSVINRVWTFELHDTHVQVYLKQF